MNICKFARCSSPCYVSLGVIRVFVNCIVTSPHFSRSFFTRMRQIPITPSKSFNWTSVGPRR
jgi:hypothetical protein